MKVLARGYSKRSIIGWTQDGAVIWMYWTPKKELAFIQMSPSIARQYAKKLRNLDSHTREILNDCSYSAARHGTVENNLCVQWIINPRENPKVKTIGISLSWMDLGAVPGGMDS
jgi:hypothetical protein